MLACFCAACKPAPYLYLIVAACHAVERCMVFAAGYHQPVLENCHHADSIAILLYSVVSASTLLSWYGCCTYGGSARKCSCGSHSLGALTATLTSH